MTEHWPWDQPPNCAVITERDIIENGAPILHVTHDLDDHGWQFLGLGDAEMEDAMVVALSKISEIDPSLELVADLLPGWRAWRNTADDPWRREPYPSSPDSDIS